MRFLITDNIKDVVNSFKSQADAIEKQSVIEMWRALSILEIAIKQNIRVRSGLKVRSGSLLNSIQKSVSSDGNTVTGRIGPENIPYAQIHEFGGIIPERRVEPRHGTALKWLGSNGEFWFSKGHIIPQTRIPARPYLEPALDEKAEEIREKFGIFIQKIMEIN